MHELQAMPPASTRVVSVSLTPELVTVVKAIGERDGRKVSAIIEDILWRSGEVRDMAAAIAVERRQRGPMGRPPNEE